MDMVLDMNLNLSQICQSIPFDKTEVVTFISRKRRRGGARSLFRTAAAFALPVESGDPLCGWTAAFWVFTQQSV